MKTMNNIKGLLFTVIALFALTNVSNAAGIGGVYLEVGTSAVGSELDGKVVETASTPNETSTGQVGKTAVTTSYGLGFMTDRSRKVGLDVGYMINPGSAKIKSDTTQGGGEVTFEITDSTDYYLAPMINITEDASLFVKFGKAKSDLKIVGDVTKLNSMEGDTLALGTVMSWGSNLYIRTEAGKTKYDGLKVVGLGTAGGVAATTTVTADPTVHYGKIAIGYKF
jgi:hypothetical protein